MIEKRLKVGEDVCLFCGELKTKKWDEMTPYFECDCCDATLDRKITDDIEKLKRSRPIQKFKLEKRLYIVKE